MAYALITGASKGIGKALAENLAKRKYNLLLISRTEKLLAELAAELQNKYGITVLYYPIDLSAPNGAEDVMQWCKKGGYDINVLINNAGYGLHGAFAGLPLDDQLNMMSLNMNTYISMTHKALPLLKQQQGKSYILNIASTAAYQAVPYLSVYSATKAFVLSFSRALRHELKGTNVSVTCLSPGAVDTNFMERAGMDKVKKIVKQANKFNMNAADVAEFGIKAMLQGKAEVIPGFSNKIGAFANRLLPKSLVEGVAKGLYSPEGK
jgi:uncharacterized protein